jgi:diguanylate cyclase (GGDEF)-like protein/PAS domain S-box-containing protein
LIEAAERVADLGVTLETAIGRTPPRAETTAGTPKRPDQRLQTLLSKAVEGLVVIDGSGMIRYVSPGLVTLLGVGDDLLGRDALDLVHPEDAPAVRGALATVLAREEGDLTLEFRAEHVDGTWRWLEARATNLLAEPSVHGIALSLRDVSEQKSNEDDLRHRALHDTLTGLPNRTLLLDRLRGAIGRAGREARSVAVFFLDLDAFKEVNDNLGHAAGDEVLVGVGRRLAAIARTQDTVARYGGDEFVVVLEHDQGPAWVMEFADRMRAVFCEPVRAEQKLVTITASFGIASASKGTATPEGLLRDADAAMYRAKQNGGDAYAVFDDSMIDHTVVDLTVD